MSSFDVKKYMKERRLKEEAEKIHGKQQFSAPPSIFRSSRPHSTQSSLHEFGDAESIRVRSDGDVNDWFRDEIRHSPTQKEKQRHWSLKTTSWRKKRNKCNQAFQTGFSVWQRR